MPPPAQSSENRFLRWFAQTWPLWLWCALATAVGVKAIVSPTRHNVWPIFAAASQHWGLRLPLYAYYPRLDTYRYSPAFAVAITPLASLPLPIGGCLWGMGSVVLLYAGLSRLHRDVLADGTGMHDRRAFLALSAIGVAPMAWNLQSNVLLLALVAYGTAAAARGNRMRAAFALVAPVFIKLWPAAWLVVVMVRRPRAMVIPVACAAAAFAALPFLVDAPNGAAQVYREWGESLGENHVQRWPGYRDAITVVNAAGIPIDPLTHRTAQFIGAAGVLAAAWSANRYSPRRGLAVGLLAWMCWQLLLGPGSERNTYGMILPLIAWEALCARRSGGGWLFPATAMAIVFLFSSGDVERAVGRHAPWAAAILPAAVATFALGIALQALQLRRHPLSSVVGPFPVRVPLSAEERALQAPEGFGINHRGTETRRKQKIDL
ncbi:MAG TPA: glycosyltransferase family 87 protein [Urbifossiella sp.]|nr:glycosyltransferase family 87 protein [Urbifossiella sp.]